MPIEKQIYPNTDENLEETIDELTFDLADDGISIENDDDIEIEAPEEGGANVFFGGIPEEQPEESFDSNLAEFIDETTLGKIGSEILSDVEADEESRKEWDDILAEHITLLGLKHEVLQEPFPGASTVTHPILMESIVKFHAKAYDELLPPKGPVKTQVVGQKTPEKEAQARRVKNFMNYQIMHEMTEYVPEMDSLIFRVGLMGSAFKKTYFDSALNRPRSILVKAEDFIIDYYASDLETSERYAHKIKISGNDVVKYINSGLYRQTDLGDATPDDLETEVEDELRQIEGRDRPQGVEGVHTFYEVHLNFDLPGYGDESGLALPYTITVDKETSKVLSIYRNWSEDDQLKQKKVVFTHYKFIPGLGFYGYGYLHLIGGLARAATSSLRQLSDAGTFANLPAGFKAHGLRVSGDAEPIMPGEWREVNAAGLDISKALVPLPFKEPSPTLMNLLQFVVEAAQKFADATEQVVADSTNYGPVGTTMALLEASGKLFTAIHKRLHFAQMHDLKLLAGVNFEYLPQDQAYPYEAVENTYEVFKNDFDGRVDIIPVSDPNMPSRSHRLAKAQTMLQTAMGDPQGHDMREVYTEMYTALDYENPEQFLVKIPPPPEPQDPITENMLAMTGKPIATAEWEEHEAHLTIHMNFLQDPQYQGNPMLQQIIMVHIQEHLAHKYRLDMQQVMGVQLPPLGQQLPPEVQSQIALKAEEASSKLLEKDSLEAQQEELQQMAEDPAIQLQKEQIRVQEKEIDLKHATDQRKLDIEQVKVEVDDQNRDEDREAREEVAKIQLRGRNKSNGKPLT